MTENERHDEQHYLCSVNSTSHDDDEGTVTLDICKKPVEFKIDSGVDCSKLRETVYETLELGQSYARLRKYCVVELFGSVYHMDQLKGQNTHSQALCC